MKKKIQQFIIQPEEHDSFNEVAIELFRYLYHNNLAYQKFCRQKGIGFKQVTHWKEIPSVPTEAFNMAHLSVAPKEECSHVFTTSGTTSGKKGEHYHQDLEIYDISAKQSFQQFVNDKSLPTGILFPDETDMPNSSLAHYLELLKSDGTNDSQHFISKNGLELDAFIEWTKKNKDTPVLILGASYNYVHLFDALKESNVVLNLHEDSLIFDTGGFKNFSKTYSQKEFYQKIKEVFKIKTNPFNMYGMTELSSQYYTEVRSNEERIKKGPHWIRFKIINPLNGKEMPKGEIGLLVHVDLANINSVPAIQTGDLAIERDGGFELIGRQVETEPKGCSLSAEQWLREHSYDTN